MTALDFEQSSSAFQGTHRICNLSGTLVPETGPLLADIVCMDGSVVGVSLVLGDGERRELALR